MSLFKQLSQTFWSYVSPATPYATPKKSPIEPFPKPTNQQKKGDLRDLDNRDRSMSPASRVDSWRVESSSEALSEVVDSQKWKRKRPIIPTLRQVSRKSRKMDDVDMEDVSDVEYDEEEESPDEDEGDEDVEDEEMDDVSTSISDIRVRSSPYEEDDTQIDSSLVVSESDYNDMASRRKRLVQQAAEFSSSDINTEEMRAAGWDDDHITLVQKIAMRGQEPLMPNDWRMNYRFSLPDSLFLTVDADDTDAIINSVRQEYIHSRKAMDRLFELGGRMRDRVVLRKIPEGLPYNIRPEQQVRRMLKEYIKWVDKDSQLDQKTAIPLLVIENQPANTPAAVMKQNAKRKCAELAKRYRNAFRVLQSIENSPGSRTSTQFSYPVPTLYAIVASHTLIALAAYNPEDAEPDIKMVATFEMKDKDYDVWNALALAIVVCHVRNVQVRIAEETGLGVRSGAREPDKEEDDPDL